jgi:hypothetical protein
VYAVAMSLVGTHYGFESSDWTPPEIIWRLLVNPDFQQEVEQIREQLKIEETVDEIEQSEELDEKEERVAERLLEFIDSAAVQKAANNLAKKFKVPKRWVGSIAYEIVGGGFYESFAPDAIYLVVRTDKDSTEPEFYIKINENTTLAEIKKRWPAITEKVKMHAPKRTKSQKPWNKRWRDYAVYQYAREGKTIDEILHLVEEKFGEDLDYGNIKKIESAFRNKVGIGKQFRQYKLKTSKHPRKLPILGQK